MFMNTSDLLNYNIQATDKELGKIKDIYIDEPNWAVRYAVADTRKWLPGRKVLIATSALDTADIKNGILKVSISSEKVKESPPITDDEPVSREYEEKLHDHYMWTPYWSSLAGPAPVPLPDTTDAPPPPQEMNYEKNNSLRSISTMADYQVESSTGAAGSIENFIINDEHWHVAFAVVETDEWLSGRRVLIDRRLIQSADWKSRSLSLAVTREQLAEAPLLKDYQPITESYIDMLEDHYNLKSE